MASSGKFGSGGRERTAALRLSVWVGSSWGVWNTSEPRSESASEGVGLAAVAPDTADNVTEDVRSQPSPATGFARELSRFCGLLCVERNDTPNSVPGEAVRAAQREPPWILFLLRSSKADARVIRSTVVSPSWLCSSTTSVGRFGVCRKGIEPSVPPGLRLGCANGGGALGTERSRTPKGASAPPFVTALAGLPAACRAGAADLVRARAEGDGLAT